MPVSRAIKGIVAGAVLASAAGVIGPGLLSAALPASAPQVGTEPMRRGGQLVFQGSGTTSECMTSHSAPDQAASGQAVK